MFTYIFLTYIRCPKVTAYAYSSLFACCYLIEGTYSNYYYHNPNSSLHHYSATHSLIQAISLH